MTVLVVVICLLAILFIVWFVWGPQFFRPHSNYAEAGVLVPVGYSSGIDSPG